MASPFYPFACVYNCLRNKPHLSSTLRGKVPKCVGTGSNAPNKANRRKRTHLIYTQQPQPHHGILHRHHRKHVPAPIQVVHKILPKNIEGALRTPGADRQTNRQGEGRGEGGFEADRHRRKIESAGRLKWYTGLLRLASQHDI